MAAKAPVSYWGSLWTEDERQKHKSYWWSQWSSLLPQENKGEDTAQWVLWHSAPKTLTGREILLRMSPLESQVSLVWNGSTSDGMIFKFMQSNCGFQVTMHRNHQQSLLKHRFLGPNPRVSDAESLGWGLKIYISNMFQQRWCCSSGDHTRRATEMHSVINLGYTLESTRELKSTVDQLTPQMFWCN